MRQSSVQDESADDRRGYNSFSPFRHITLWFRHLGRYVSSQERKEFKHQLPWGSWCLNSFLLCLFATEARYVRSVQTIHGYLNPIHSNKEKTQIRTRHSQIHLYKPNKKRIQTSSALWLYKFFTYFLYFGLKTRKVFGSLVSQPRPVSPGTLFRRPSSSRFNWVVYIITRMTFYFDVRSDGRQTPLFLFAFSLQKWLL